MADERPDYRELLRKARNMRAGRSRTGAPLPAVTEQEVNSFIQQATEGQARSMAELSRLAYNFARQEQESAAEQRTGRMAALQSGVRQGLTFGTWDELSGQPGASAEVEQAMQDRPGYMLAGEVLGALPLAMLTGGAGIARLASYPARLGASALLGGAQAGGMAMGQGEGTLGERAASAWPAALVGAAAGGAFTPLAGGLGTAISGAAARPVEQNLLQRRVAPREVVRPELGRRGAEDIVARMAPLADEQGIATRAAPIRAAISELEQSTGPGVVRAADTDFGTSLLETVAAETGAPARRVLGSRVQQAREDLVNRLGRQPTSVEQRTAELARARRAVAEKTYGEVERIGQAPFEQSQMGLEATRLLDELAEGDPGIIDRAWQRARTVAQLRGYKLKPILQRNAQGQWERSGRETPDFITMQTMLEQLDDEVSGMFQTPGMRSVARELGDRLTVFREGMRTNFPGLREADDAYRGATRAMEAPELGADVWSAGVDARSVRAYLNDPRIPEEAKTLYRESALDALAGRLRGQRATTDPTTLLENAGPELLDKMEAVGVSNEALDAARRWGRVAETSARAFGNSQTTPRLASRTQAGLSPTEGVQGAQSFLRNLLDPLRLGASVRANYGAPALSRALTAESPEPFMGLLQVGPRRPLPLEVLGIGGTQSTLGALGGRVHRQRDKEGY